MANEINPYTSNLPARIPGLIPPESLGKLFEPQFCIHHKTLTDDCLECVPPDMPEKYRSTAVRAVRADQLRIGQVCPGLGAIIAVTPDDQAGMINIAWAESSGGRIATWTPFWVHPPR